jgi:hypothetical protein
LSRAASGCSSPTATSSPATVNRMWGRSNTAARVRSAAPQDAWSPAPGGTGSRRRSGARHRVGAQTSM